MRGGFYILLAGIGATAGILACPEPVRQDIAERAAIPEHVVVETERQIDVFVAWVRNDDQQPEPEETINVVDIPL